MGAAMEGIMVTVLMAVYDPPLEMLAQAVDSILAQTFRDFEFLIVDDGSCAPGLQSWLGQRARCDPRIRIAEEAHRGLTASLNRGLALARGEWIARQDADDWSEPARLASQVEYFRAHPRTTVLGTGTWTHQQDGGPLWPLHLPAGRAEILRWLPRGNPFVHGSVMFPRAAAAHPVPFTYLDLRLSSDAIEGTLVAHIFDLGHDLNIDPAERLLDPAVAALQAAAIANLFAGRLTVAADGVMLTPHWSSAQVVADRSSLKLAIPFSMN